MANLDKKNKTDEMFLPEGNTCGDCVHFGRCKWLIGATDVMIRCDFYPSLFAPAMQNEGGRK